MPYWEPTDGDVLTAADAITYIAEQVTSTVTAGTRPSGTAGQLIFETDTERFQAYDGSGWVQFSQLGAWTTWTPTLTQSGAVTYSATYSTYTRIGTTVIANCQLQVTGGAPVANNAVTVTLPVTAVSANAGGGNGFVRDSSASQIAAGVANIESTTTATLIDATQVTNALRLGVTSAAFAAALASGDLVRFTIIYEAA